MAQTCSLAQVSVHLLLALDQSAVSERLGQFGVKAAQLLGNVCCLLQQQQHRESANCAMCMSSVSCGTAPPPVTYQLLSY